MSEIITLQIGNAGINLGLNIWELLLKENENNYSNPFFQESDTNTYSPRSIFIDTDPFSINKIKNNSNLKSIFKEEYLLSYKEDSQNNFAKGYYSYSLKQFLPKIEDTIRKCVESCSNLQGFIIVNSICGGTGSGLGSLLLEKIAKEFNKASKFTFSIFPSENLTFSPIESYNCVLSLAKLIDFSNFTVFLQNESLYDISRNLNISNTNFKVINQMISQSFSSFTAPMRFNSSNLFNLREYETNLVPYPRIHFFSSIFSKFLPIENENNYEFSLTDVVNNCFNRKNAMTKINILEKNLNFSYAINFRAVDNKKEAYNSVQKIKNKYIKHFADWNPNLFKLNFIDNKNSNFSTKNFNVSEMSACGFVNNSSIGEIYAQNDRKFDELYAKRFFVHQFIEKGMEELQFSEAREDVAALEKDIEWNENPYWIE